MPALLNREIVKSLAAPEMKDRQAMLGNDVVASTPEEFGASGPNSPPGQR